MALLVSRQYGGGRAWKEKRSQLVSQTVYSIVHYIFPLPLYVCEIYGLYSPLKNCNDERNSVHGLYATSCYKATMHHAVFHLYAKNNCFAMLYLCQW